MLCLLSYSQLQAEKDAAREYAGVSNELEKVTDTLHILESLLELHQLHQTVNTQLNLKDYGETSAALAKMKLLLGKLEESSPGLEIIKVEYDYLVWSFDIAIT